MKEVVPALLVLTFGFSSFAETTFVEACLGDTKILNGTLSCEVKIGESASALDLTLIKGEKIAVKTSGIYGKHSGKISVVRIKHLPPRITSLGVLPESVQFQAKSGSTMAVVTIPCHQSDVVAMGIERVSGDYTPTEQIGYCSLR